MSRTHQYYNLFSKEGKLIQVENAIEAINASTPIIIARNSETIICVSKKQATEKLAERNEKSVFQINSSTYGSITGMAGDCDQVKYSITSMAVSKEYNLGFEPTADIICRSYADKIQKLIQSTGKRAFAFGMAVFGFEEGRPMIYYTDTSAVCYPYFAIGIGEHASKINKFLEKQYSKEMDDNSLFEIALEGMGHSIGNDHGPGDVDVCYLKRDENLCYLNNEEIDAILLKISEKE